jgi:hypothetical protein
MGKADFLGGQGTDFKLAGFMQEKTTLFLQEQGPQLSAHTEGMACKLPLSHRRPFAF